MSQYSSDDTNLENNGTYKRPTIDTRLILLIVLYYTYTSKSLHVENKHLLVYIHRKGVQWSYNGITPWEYLELNYTLSGSTLRSWMKKHKQEIYFDKLTFMAMQ